MQHFKDSCAVFEGEEGGGDIVEFIFHSHIFKVVRNGGKTLFLF